MPVNPVLEKVDLAAMPNAAGIEYDKVIAAHGNPIPFLRKGSRDELRAATGSEKLPALKLPDGTVLTHSRAILAWIEQLNEVDVTGIAPMTSVVAQKLKMRDDVVTDGGEADALMENAPGGEDHFFVVPKVIE